MAAFPRTVHIPEGMHCILRPQFMTAHPFILCGEGCGTSCSTVRNRGDLSQKLYVLSKKAWPLDHSVRMKQPFPPKMITGLGVFVSTGTKGDFCPHVVCPSVSVILRTNLSWFGFACSYAYFQKRGSSIKIAKMKKDFKIQKLSCHFRYFTADVLSSSFFLLPHHGQEKGPMGCLTQFLIPVSQLWFSCTIKSYTWWSS